MLIYQCIHIVQMSIMNFCKMSIMNFCKISFDFKVGSGRFWFGSFLNNRLKWSVWVVSAMLKVGASLHMSDLYFETTHLFYLEIKSFFSLIYFVYKVHTSKSSKSKAYILQSRKRVQIYTYTSFLAETDNMY